MVQYMARSRWLMLRWLARKPVTQTSSIQKNLTVVAALARAAAVPGLVMKSHPVQSVE